MTLPPGASSAEPPTETASAAQWPHLTGQAVSDFIGFSPTMLRKLEKEGFVRRLDDKLFDAGAVLLGYILWLKDDARRNSKTEGAKAKDAEQVRRLQIANARELGELVEIELVATVFAEIFTALRSEMGAVPAGITRDPELRADIEKRHNDAFERCRLAFEAMRAALRSRGAVLDGDEEGEP